MNSLKITTILLGALGGISGLVAARYWLKSSKIPALATGGGFEPLETEDKALGWALGSIEAFTESSTLNRKAARWTAISVLLSTLSCFTGSLA